MWRSLHACAGLWLCVSGGRNALTSPRRRRSTQPMHSARPRVVCADECPSYPFRRANHLHRHGTSRESETSMFARVAKRGRTDRCPQLCSGKGNQSYDEDAGRTTQKMATPTQNKETQTGQQKPFSSRLRFRKAMYKIHPISKNVDPIRLQLYGPTTTQRSCVRRACVSCILAP